MKLRTERLLLRPFRPDDVDDAVAYRDDPEFARFLPHIPQPFTRRHAQAFVARNIDEPWESMPTFAVVLEDRVIGTVNLEIDASNRTAMIGYAIARAHWGRGIATEAATAVMAWAFESHGLVEVWASTNPDHLRSRRVMEKLGMMQLPDRDGEVRFARRTPAAPVGELLSRALIDDSSQLQRLETFLDAELFSAGIWDTARGGDGVLRDRVLVDGPDHAVLVGEVFHIDQTLHLFCLLLERHENELRWSLLFGLPGAKPGKTVYALHVCRILEEHWQHRLHGTMHDLR